MKITMPHSKSFNVETMHTCTTVKLWKNHSSCIFNQLVFEESKKLGEESYNIIVLILIRIKNIITKHFRQIAR